MDIELKRMEKQNAADTVIKQLIELMVTNKLKPGGRLPSEGEIAAQIGVGRNSVREAMKVLQTLGLVERRQGDGSYLAESYQMPFEWLLFPLISRLKTSSHLVELRCVLELGITELVISKASVGDIEQLHERLLEFEAFSGCGDDRIDDAVDADVAFHVALAGMTHNPAIIELAKLVMKLFEPSMKLHIQTADGFAEATRDHRTFLGAIRNGDLTAARQVVFSSFDSWQQFITM